MMSTVTFLLTVGEDARYWAEQALDDFDRLGMQPEVEKTQQLLHELNHLEN